MFRPERPLRFHSSAASLAEVREDIGEAHRIGGEFKMLWNHAADQGDLEEMRRCWAQLRGLRTAVTELEHLGARLIMQRQIPLEYICQFN